MSQSVDTSDLDQLVESWDKLLKEFPQAKRELLAEMEPQMLQKVLAAIGGSGKVQGWQEPHMGSGGGYVAIRPKAKTYQVTQSGKKYAVGHITNAIEGGHKHGGPRGGTSPGYSYRPRYQTATVPGKHFYQNVRQQISSMGDEVARKLTQKIVDGLEGKL